MINLPTLKYIFLISTLLVINKNSALAQITPDNTLGAESSRVVPNGSIDKIDGGALRDQNLFHSFKEFNINNGQSVYFSNPSGIENILTRVTGGNASNIFGTLGVDGAANLFLINPNGIIFGENARLDVQGSFVGSTANGVQFGEQGNFSATNPQAPGLLTVNPNALFFNQIQANGRITNKSQANAGINPEGNETTGLRVPDGKSLLLVGGNINLDGGSLRAYEGNVELASVSAPGSMGLDIFGDTFGLNVSEDVQKGDISIANESNISIFGKFGGNIVINARNFEISNSFIFAGSLQKEGNPEAQAGDVNINATDSILLKDGAFIDNSVYSQGNAGDIFLKASNSISLVDRSLISNNIEAGGIGKGGNINITAGSLSLTKDSEIQALLRRADVENNLPSEQGNLGNIFLQTSNSVSLVNSNIFNSIEAGGIGNGGNINITAGSLSLIDGSEIQARLDNADVENNLPGGQGNVGNITVNVRDTVTIAGIKDGIGSDISNFVGTDAIGNAGDININADSLSLAEASEINAKTLGQGNAGNITVNARQNISLDGSGDVTLSDGSNRIRPTRIISFVNPEAVGNAGDIQLNTETLSVTNEALISSSTTGKGNAGNITINAKNTVTFDTSGYADSVVGANVIGNAGDIRVTTRALSLTNGGQLSSSVLGSGNAGNIFVEARDSVQLDGLVGNAFSGIQSNLLTEGVGNGGDIQITTGVLSVTNGAKISANTSGQGDAGNITLNVRDQVNFDGFDTNTGFFSQVSTLVDSNGVGNGGDIRVNTGELLLKNGANILTVNSGKGNAGDIFLDVRDTITFDGRSSNTFLGSSIFRIPSAASSYADNGNAGNIEVKTGSLFLTNGGLINAGAFPDENSSDIANGGNIIINARDTIKFDGASSGLNSTLLRGTGKGGDIQITTGSLSVTNGAFLGAFTNGRGNAGNININARDTVTFDGHSSFAYTLVLDRGIGDAGDIEITTGSLFLNNGASFSTLTAGKGDAGEIQIDTANSISLSNSSFITSNVLPGGEGKGGEIDISAQTLTLTGKSEIAVSSNGIGDAGDIEVQAETLQLDNGFIRAQTASTQGGDINLELSEKLVLRNSSQITTTAGTAQAEGDGGNISINSPFIVALPNENSDITANAFTGNGGNVDIVIQGIFGITPAAKPTLQSDITASSETGIQGEISVTDPEINPSQGLIELPDGVVDKSNQIAQICPRGINAKKLSEFFITGKGSLPPSPLDMLTGTVELSRLATLDGESVRGGRGGRGGRGERGGREGRGGEGEEGVEGGEKNKKFRKLWKHGDL